MASAWLAIAGTPAPADEFPVNSYTTSNQGRPAVAPDAIGNFVVVWHSNTQDGSGYGIFGQRFLASGVRQGSEFQVNSFTSGQQTHPSVASDGAGNFLVVWQNQDQQVLLVSGQLFDATGTPQGAEFAMNSSTTEVQDSPRVAADGSGNFVVAWRNIVGSNAGVSARRFNTAGAPMGTEFQVSSPGVTTPSVASDAAGNFVVVWSEPGNNPSGVFGQRVDSSGTAQGAKFQVNSYTTGSHWDPVVASDATGNFVVVWTNYGQDGSAGGIFGQRFDAMGVPQGPEFQVNSYTTGSQRGPAVASDTSGNFTVVWQTDGLDGHSQSISGQRYDASGTPQGSEFRVNSYTPAARRGASVALQPNGDPVLIWESAFQDGSGVGVFGELHGDLIFKDGFESGDMSRWSASAADGADLSASGAAAMAGTTTGLQALVDDTNPLYVGDNSPNNENRYRARFYFSPHGFDPGEASGHQRVRILIAHDPRQLRVVTLILRRVSGEYTIQGRVRRNDGTRDDTAFIDVTDAPHLIEFDWMRSSGPGASDGAFEMWIDEVSVATLSGLDNHLSGIDSLRMGALSVKTGASGTLYFDEFESRRESYIGP